MDSTDGKGKLLETAPGKRNPVVRLGGLVLGPPRHICAFFNSHDDEYRVLLPFIKDGLECGEKAVHTIDPDRREEHLKRLAKGVNRKESSSRIARHVFASGLSEKRGPKLEVAERSVTSGSL